MIQDVKQIYLCSPDRQILYALNGVRTETVSLHMQVKDYSELTFDVDRFIVLDGQQVESVGYEELKAYMYLYIEEIGYFQIQAPTQTYDGNEEYRTVTAYSAEKEFEDKDWLGFKVNTGENDSLEYIATDNKDSGGFAKRYVTVYNQSNPELSLLDQILSKVSYWTVGHVDNYVKTLKVPNISLDNTNLYAILTTEVGPRLSILFTFDFLNCKINAYFKDELDIDTGIFIGFRNLANNVNISVNEDSIFTRFRIRGENDLTIRDWNYNDERYDDLSYFMGEPYMNQELAEKIQAYYDFREEHRQEFADISKEVSGINEKIYDKTYKVPADEAYWTNWSNMNEEGLTKNRAYYVKILELLQIAVDDRPNSEKYSDYGGDNEKYLPKEKNGEVDHDWYLDKLYACLDLYSGYYTYQEIITYIIPYIDLALENLNKPSSQKKKPDYDATENWTLYGVVELEGKLEEYQDKLDSLSSKFSKPWSQMTEAERNNYANETNYKTAGRDSYVHYQNCIGTEDTPGTILYQLKVLNQELDDLNNQFDAKNAKRNEWVEIMKLECQFNVIDTEDPVVYRPQNTIFTEDEIDLIINLYHDTDYTNSNILTTTLDNVYTTIDREKELLDDARDKLSEVSQPQFAFSVDIDNLLRIPEFEAWTDDFQLLSFIRVGIRDDYSVKLRIMGYTWNPCEIDPNLTIDFSSMITNNSGRSDLTQILNNENNRGAKNSIALGVGNSRSDQEYITSLLEVLTKNSIFTAATRNIASGVAGVVDPVTINNLISEYIDVNKIKADSIDVKNITGDTADFKEVFADYIGAETVVAELVDAEEGIFERLSSRVITVGEEGITKLTEDTIKTATFEGKQINVDEALIRNVVTIGEESFTKIAEDTITTGNIVAALVEAQAGDFDTLTSNTAFIEYLNSGVIEVDTISADTVIAALVEAEEGDFDELAANTAFIQMLNSGIIDAQVITGDQIIAGIVDLPNAYDFSLLADSAFIDYLESNLVVAHAAHVDNLEADIATINLLTSQAISSESAFFVSLQSIASSSATSVIDDAYIQDAIINKLRVSDLAAGNIFLNDNMQILSENGRMVMNGTALQISGTYLDENNVEQSYVGVQLGYDTSGQPSLILRNPDGNVVISPSGITQDAIADGLIVNNMIKPATIDADRLSFNVMKQGDHVAIEQIYMGGGTQFGVEYAEFKNSTTSALTTLQSNIDEIKQYDLYIEAPNGLNIHGGSITLYAKLLENNVDVTASWGNQYFIWTRTSDDSVGDAAWNINHSTGTKSITLTSSDVSVNARFNCKFEYDTTS